ncbi:MAG: hypothetical protein J6A88_02355 [Oscillospiraceae bacterium]|nr:hypothetical protein [Oscillospiraceae bacterium]
MEQMNQRQPNPRRRKKTKMEIFKEAYLPTIILGFAVVLILVFIIGSLSRLNNQPGQPEQLITEPTEDPVLVQQKQEVEQLLQQAEKLANEYEFQQAVAVLDSFTGDKSVFPELAYKRGEYAQQASQMVTWSDPSQIVNLSFHGLIADPQKAFANQSYGTSYNKNFVTITEFKQILDQLYDNGYVLVSLDDIFSVETDGSGNTTCQAKSLQLPLGRKPLVLTQTNLNYYTYMDNSGFASRLTVDDSGKLACQMVDAEGNTVTGDYDLVPILESFIAEHPDFSYKGARAVLAVTGYDGIFGYRTNPSVKTSKGEAYYNEQVADAKKLVETLRQTGYEIACYTYNNVAYGKVSNQEIQYDLNAWVAEVTPILGQTDILVFAQNSDIGAYSGSKFNTLHNAGFRRYLDFGSGRSGAQIGENFISFQRLMVTGSAMAHTSTSFTGLFDATEILDSQRGSVPR